MIMEGVVELLVQKKGVLKTRSRDQEDITRAAGTKGNSSVVYYFLFSHCTYLSLYYYVD